MHAQVEICAPVLKIALKQLGMSNTTLWGRPNLVFLKLQQFLWSSGYCFKGIPILCYHHVASMCMQDFLLFWFLLRVYKGFFQCPLHFISLDNQFCSQKLKELYKCSFTISSLINFQSELNVYQKISDHCQRDFTLGSYTQLEICVACTSAPGCGCHSQC